MSEPRRFRRLSAGLLAAALGGTLLLTGPVAAADEEGPGDPPELSGLPDIGSDGLDRATIRYNPENAIRRYEMARFVEELGSAEAEEEDVIVLETDILFSPNSWEMPEGAGSRLAELVEVIPDGASVQVHGHTDSRPTGADFDNQELSENRAEAVADVLGSERGDLELSVEGFGSSQPAVDENPDEPGTFAANRRVEIRYGG